MRLLSRLTVLSLLLLPCSYAGAQTETVERMVVSEQGHTLDKVDLAEVQRISFTEDAFSVDKKDGTNALYGYKAAVTFIEDDVSGIGKTAVSAHNIKVHARENLIYIEGAKPGSVVVYALNGTRCIGLAQWNGQPVDVSTLPQGIYVLKVDGASFKFRK